MSHIVIHDDQHQVTQYARFDNLQDAAAYLEELHNADGPTSAQLFTLEEVKFAVRSYVRVEIGDAAPEPESSPAPAPVAATEPPAVFDDAPAEVAETPVEEIDTVEYVEAAMAPVDAFAPTAEAPEEQPAGEVRRGLFGR
ncbi:MAG: hypothetical protein AAF548_04590 [Actinomycetota bacterium]